MRRRRCAGRRCSRARNRRCGGCGKCEPAALKRRCSRAQGGRLKKCGRAAGPHFPRSARSASRAEHVLHDCNVHACKRCNVNACKHCNVCACTAPSMLCKLSGARLGNSIHGSTV
eukprot:194939-Chlamydomonas_euryale.AAC.1